ncbi:hypothetical protein [Bradyrhizobium sp. CER78]|nr:hypothetical protein [Bradyrhizobium sp. CER78]MDH2386337.1 hypothetical protein [Bradyrhizobium sp. CER78]
MEKRYWNDVADDAGLDWEFTEKVLSSHDIAHATGLAMSHRAETFRR